MKYFALLLLPLALMLSPLSAHAQDQSDLYSVSIGWYDINDNEGATDLRFEYRWDKPLAWVIEPWAGAEVTSEGAVYALGGLLADIKIGDGFLITPSIGAGLYADGGGKDLGHVIQFRSQLEMGWEFDNGHRIGIATGHISNADLADHNPGTEYLNVYYHFPVGSFSGD